MKGSPISFLFTIQPLFKLMLPINAKYVVNDHTSEREALLSVHLLHGFIT